MNESELLAMISKATRHNAKIKKSTITTMTYIVCADCDATLGFIDDNNCAQPAVEKPGNCKGGAR